MSKTNATVDLDTVRAALDAVTDPLGAGGLVTAGRVSGLTARGGAVGFALETPKEHAGAFEAARQAAIAAIAALPGVEKVTAVLTNPGMAPPSQAAPSPPASPPPRGVRVAPSAVAPTRPAPAATRIELPGVRHMLAVASGKGGVGKSTVAANVACALAGRGLKVGVLDADIYGPSMPTLFGLTGSEPSIRPDKKLEPPTAFGLKIMSMGFLVDTDAPMIWRGPIVMSALTQLLNDVAWAPLDVLVADLPPGTGDAQLTLAQRAPLTGAVILSTPQELALADVRRGVAMFERTAVPVLGVVENMSAFTDPETGATFAPFGAGGAKEAAAAMNAPFLGALPLDPRLAALSDAGTPLAAAEPESPMGRAFADLAGAVWAGLEAGPGRTPPTIRFED